MSWRVPSLIQHDSTVSHQIIQREMTQREIAQREIAQRDIAQRDRHAHWPKLGARLSTVASLYPSNTRLIDIGTDHAYLPITLVHNQIASLAYAVDINFGPLQGARRSIRNAQLDHKVLLRLGNGFHALEDSDQADVATFCGLGGTKVAELMRHAPSSIHTVIIQVNDQHTSLRRTLSRLGWMIHAERLCMDAQRLYITYVFKRTQHTQLIHQSYVDHPFIYHTHDLLNTDPLYPIALDIWSIHIKKMLDAIPLLKVTAEKRTHLLRAIQQLKQYQN